jgi:hypothetical protein
MNQLKTMNTAAELAAELFKKTATPNQIEVEAVIRVYGEQLNFQLAAARRTVDTLMRAQERMDAMEIEMEAMEIEMEHLKAELVTANMRKDF